MQIAILGPLTASDDSGQSLVVSGVRVRAMLAMLALEPGKPLAAERLVDGLWGDDPPARTGNALATLAKRLRTSLGDIGAIAARAPGYVLLIDPDAVDATRFARLAEAGRQALRSGDLTAAIDTLGQALALWRGPALDDVLAAPFAVAAAARLTGQRLTALEDRAQAQLAAGQPAEAASVLVHEQQREPLREQLTALTMRALAGSGRQTEALALYERTRSLLAEELGVDPSPLLREAQLAVLRGETPPPAKAANGNLRRLLTPILGREQEIARITALLADEPLVTIVGPGGAGKTRLALECAARLAGQWPDGTWLVELAALTDPDAVAPAVLAALGSRDGVPQAHPEQAETATSRLIQVLSGKHLLLVLDNCEHLIDTVADLTAQLLGACPGLRVLATTREPLSIPGETLSPIPPLPLPPPEVTGAATAGYAAVALFTERAAAVRPGFAVDDTNGAAIGAICRRLDGMPLAIELAAARVRVLTPEQIADRLDDRFRLLTGGSRAALPRHQTLQAVVEWSWERLSEAEARTARLLSVFAAGATLDEVESVCGTDDTLDTLASLVDKSLVEVNGDRYLMLETIRAYAARQLAQAGAEAQAQAWTALARGQLAQARAAEPLLRTRAQLASIDRLAAAEDNAVAALRWAADSGETGLALSLCASLSWYWWLRGQRGQAARQARYVLARTKVGDELLPAYATCLLASNIERFVDPLDFTAVTGKQAWLTGMIEVIDRLDSCPPDAVNPLLLISAASLLAVAGRTDDALTRLDGYAADGDQWLANAALMMRGSLRDDAADLAQAVDGFRALGERWGLSQSLMLLIRHRAMRGSLSEVDELMAEAESLIDGWLSAEEVIAAVLRHLYLRVRAGDADAAARDASRARSYVTVSVPASAVIQIDLADAAIAAMRGSYADAWPTFEHVIAVLGAAPRDFPRELAFARASYGRALSAAGQHVAAAAQFRAALTALGSLEDRHMRIMLLVNFAVAAEAAGEAERAMLILAGCQTVFGGGLANPNAVQARERARIALGEAAFAAVWARGTALNKEELLAAI